MNNNNLQNLQRGDMCHIKFNERINKTATFYEHANNKYLFKDDSGFFELSENYINNSNIIIEIMTDY